MHTLEGSQANIGSITHQRCVCMVRQTRVSPKWGCKMTNTSQGPSLTWDSQISTFLHQHVLSEVVTCVLFNVQACKEKKTALLESMDKVKLSYSQITNQTAELTQQVLHMTSQVRSQVLSAASACSWSLQSVTY